LGAGGDQCYAWFEISAMPVEISKAKIDQSTIFFASTEQSVRELRVWGRPASGLAHLRLAHLHLRESDAMRLSKKAWPANGFTTNLRRNWIYKPNVHSMTPIPLHNRLATQQQGI
jgi:hypothetical protein